MDEANAFRERNPFSVTNEERAKDLDVARLRMRESPPLRLGLLFGDVLANWRSALDNLAYQLILLNGRIPGERETIGFPLFESQRSFKAVGVKRIRGWRRVRLQSSSPFSHIPLGLIRPSGILQP
jgi:hypothetical protein